MPVIHIEYDDTELGKDDILTLSHAVQKIVSAVTKIEDVFVYANSAQIKVNIAPVEVFVEMSAHKIKDVDALLAELKSEISQWKKKNKISYLINLTLTPMPWKIAIGI